MKKTHLLLEDRFTISQMLSQQCSFKQIADALSKNCSPISREIRNHLQFRRSGGYGRSYNACRIGSSYSDYLDYCREHPGLPVTQMDSVEGKKVEKSSSPSTS